MSLVINKDRFTKVALSFVEPMQDYDKDEIVAQTAIELARLFHNELVEEMPADEELELRRIFKVIAWNAIDWTRLNRKAHPDEYADSSWRMAEEVAQMEVNL
jgi:hypothetical protein